MKTVAIVPAAGSGSRMNREISKQYLSLAGKPLLVTPDFEVVVLPEGDVAGCVHRLGGYAQRVKSGDVVHFRLTRDSIEDAVAEGRDVEELLTWLTEKARGPVPGNVATSVRAWAAGVTFGTLERGVVLRLPRAEALDAVLAVAVRKPLVVRFSFGRARSISWCAVLKSPRTTTHAPSWRSFPIRSWSAR